MSFINRSITSAAIHFAGYVPIDEGHPLQAQSPYSASKIAADKLVEAFHRSFDLPTVTARPFNTFGPRQSIRAVIPTIVIQCLKGNKIYLGNQYPMRDFNYVSDIVEGFLLAAVAPKAVGRTVNIGSGETISVAKLARLIARIMKKRISIRSDSKRVRFPKSEVECLKADNALARDLIGWKSRYSLERGLRITIGWMRKNLERHSFNAYTFQS